MSRPENTTSEEMCMSCGRFFDPVTDEIGSYQHKCYLSVYSRPLNVQKELDQALEEISKIVDGFIGLKNLFNKGNKNE